MNSTPSTPQPAAGPEPGRDVAGVYVACGVIRTSMPSAREGNAIAPQYAEQARLHHERAVASLDEIEAPRAVPLSRAQRQELLTRALEDVIFACRLLLRAQQELRSDPGTALEPRRADAGAGGDAGAAVVPPGQVGRTGLAAPPAPCSAIPPRVHLR